MNEFDSLHHVCLPVAHLEQSIAWYMSSFKCSVIYQDKREAILQFANVRLVLSLPSSQQRHIAFTRSDAAAFGELAEQADGCFETQIADPTGNIVGLVTTALPEDAR
jgi:catechol 2,3-dioxygenase-like lactoylglutathione lyase family enzyme